MSEIFNSRKFNCARKSSLEKSIACCWREIYMVSKLVKYTQCQNLKVPVFYKTSNFVVTRSLSRRRNRLHGVRNSFRSQKCNVAQSGLSTYNANLAKTVPRRHHCYKDCVIYLCQDQHCNSSDHQCNSSDQHHGSSSRNNCNSLDQRHCYCDQQYNYGYRIYPN